MIDLQNLSNQALLEKTREVVKEESETTTRVIHHLREVERRKLFSDLGYSSLFEFAMRDLHYCEASAHRRIAAMRLLKELPELEEKIESGSLSLSVISQAQTFFRHEAKLDHKMASKEKREIFSVLEGKSTRETARELLSRSSAPERLRPEVVKPVSQTHSELRFLVSDETLQQLERVRGLLGHKHAEMSMSELIAEMAKITLEKLNPAREPKRTKTQQTQPEESKTQVSQLVSAQKPRAAREYIRAATQSEIWQKAQGKCALCGSVHRLQIDHIRPLALGGTSEKENLRLLCFHCNQRQADLKIGSQVMGHYRNKST